MTLGGSFLTQWLSTSALFHVYGNFYLVSQRIYDILHPKSPESEILMTHPDLILDWSVDKRHCTSMGVFLCNECGKNFEEEAYLYMHQSRTHDMGTFSCEKFGENVVGKKTLENHMRKHNTAVGKLKTTRKCDICPYETKDQANLSKHTKRVHSEKPEKVKKSRDCSDCGKNFSEKR